MRLMQSAFLLLSISLITMLGLRSLQGGAARPALNYPLAFDTGAAHVRITFGVIGAEPREWDGSLAVNGGELVRLDAWNFAASDSLTGSEWKLTAPRPAPAKNEGKAKAKAAATDATAKAKGKGKAAQQPAQPGAAGLVAVVRGEDAKLEVTTKQGNFSVSLNELRSGRMTWLQGTAAIERIPTSGQITSAPNDDDYPASAVAKDGTVWIAFVAYTHGNPIDTTAVNAGRFDSLVTKGNGDQVELMKFDGKEWSAPMEVSAAGLDVWRPTVAVDGKGVVHVIWAQNVNGNWDLHERSYDPQTKQWSNARKVTAGAGADTLPVSTTDSRGRVWVAWQSWIEGRFHIMTGQLDNLRVARSTPVLGRTGNSWHPAIAADSKGKVFVAWDHYHNGNYDVALETIDTNQGNRGPGSAVLVTQSPRFEARPSLVVDRQDRLWVAFEDADENWGKDYGSRWEGRLGIAFWIRRNISVRVLEGGRLLQPGEVKSTAVQTDLLAGGGPAEPNQRIAHPRLGLDPDGRVWLAYRHHPLTTGAGERWQSFAKYATGDSWSSEVALPNSDNLLDNRPALAPCPSAAGAGKGAGTPSGVGNGLLIVYSSDGRVGGTNTAQVNHLHASVLRVPTAATPAQSVRRIRRNGSVGLVAASPPPPAKAEPVHPNETEDVKRIRAHRIEVGGKSLQILRGEFHRHTEISSHRDQDGPYEEIFRYGLDVARMDWIGPGDHDNGVGPLGMTHEYTWWISQKQIAMYHHAPVFMPMFTYERSVVYPSGHRNVIFPKRGIRPLPRMAPAAQADILFGSPEGGSPDVKNFYAYLRFFDGICASHTSATNMGTDWRDNDPAVEPWVEIFQGHRQTYEEPNAPRAAKDAADSIGGYQPAGYVWNAFGKGYRLGFQSSSDHVSTHLSYACVYAEKPTREALMAAIKKRHTYGAMDNIVVDVRCGQQMMGDEFDLRGAPRLDIAAQGTGPIAKIDIVRQIDRAVPEYVHAFEPKTQNVKLSWTDNAAKVGAVNMYYVRIIQADGKLAWASPMWIHVK